MKARIDLSNNKLTRIRKICECSGCGRMLPKGSEIHRREIMAFGEYVRMTWCESCWNVMISCASGEVNTASEQDVRQCCQACDDYSLCETCAYLRDSRPGDITMECVKVGT